MTDTMVIAQLCGISMHMSYHTWFYHHIQPNIFENTERNGFRRLPHGRSSQFHPVLGILCTLGVAVATFLSDHAGCGAYVPGGWKLVRGCLGGAQKAYRILCVYIYIYIYMYVYIYIRIHTILYICVIWANVPTYIYVYIIDLPKHGRTGTCFDRSKVNEKHIIPRCEPGCWNIFTYMLDHL